MARPDKAAAVAELTEDFRTATATVLTEYRGLTVTSMKKLRRALGADTKYSVVKNTLTKIAAKDAGVDLSADLLAGPSAIAFIKGDPIAAAKSMRDFAKENPLLIIKGGIYEGKAITPKELMELAKQQVGNVGGYPYWSWYGFNSRVEWCACFVSWCYNQAGKSEPRFAGCEWQGVPWFQSHGQWGARGYNNLAPGDAIFFDWDLDGTADHVGIVIGTDGSRVYTVEGNSGDACKIKSYDLNYQSIKGYGLMNW